MLFHRSQKRQGREEFLVFGKRGCPRNAAAHYPVKTASAPLLKVCSMELGAFAAGVGWGRDVFVPVCACVCR